VLSLVLGLGALACGIFDVWFTKRRLLKYGVDVELNQTLKQAASTNQLDLALLKHILLKTAIPVFVGVYFDLTTLLAIYLGFKSAVTYFQLVSLQLEKYIES
jgi:hypothetical protein